MDQTPSHENHNPDLLQMIPATSMRLIEIGCSSGALAREFKKINPLCDYLGIDIDESYSTQAQRHCDRTMALDIEQADEQFFVEQSQRDCWIFGDTLEHLRDPWRILKKIREHLPRNGCVVACVPNAQHWTVVAKLCIGDFRYENSGLLDRTHLRWFTRQTLVETFTGAGFAIQAGFPRVFPEPYREKILPVIGAMAKACGVDPELVMNDALPIQFVVRAVPA